MASKNSKPVLGREAILGQGRDLARTEIEVPEWGGKVLIRELTAVEQDRLEGIVGGEGTREQRLRNLRARIVRFGVIDEAGENLFRDQDVEKLGELSGRILSHIAQAIQRISGLTEADMSEMVENFTNGQGEDLSSA